MTRMRSSFILTRLLVLLSLLAPVSALAGRSGSEELKSGLDQECRAAARLYFGEGQITSECTPEYQHYMGTMSAAPSSPRELRIGHFNVLNLGEKGSRFKSYELLARILNRW